MKMQFANGVTASEIPGAAWMKSSASSADRNCVEMARLSGGDVAVRNSRFPAGPALVFSHSEMAAFLVGAKGAEFDQMID
ncbi:DUF397 domain-containing protein [Streptomyces sp. NPDC058391]|uniref:DUF397 domain-containing protein n=1 Tax=Streptomyces sp. NPDC058391 TaxID=3346476 RepID=UPI003659CA45